KKTKKLVTPTTSAEEHLEAPVRLGKKQDSAPNPPQNSGKYKELLERLSSVKKEGESLDEAVPVTPLVLPTCWIFLRFKARQMITAEVAAGKLEESEIMTVLRMWRQQKRRKMQEENKEKLTQMDGTLEELKKTVNDLVRKGKLRGKDAGDIIKRWKMREKRRVDRQVAKQTNRACFHCRQQGHVLADCPNRGEDDQTVGNMATMHGDGICFKCGSTEHNVHRCPRKHVKGKEIF
ncbi:zinc knuckle, partial [Ancylostoma caninum]